MEISSGGSLADKSKPRSFWVVWSGWAIVIVVLVWSFGIDFLLSELKVLSFGHMVIWALSLIVSSVLFIVGLVNSIADLVRARKIGETAWNKKYIIRILVSIFGIFASGILLFVYGLLVFTVGTNL